jgi:hypothetical protein
MENDKERITSDSKDDKKLCKFIGKKRRSRKTYNEFSLTDNG